MVTHNPLHGSGRAGLPHPALALGDNAKSPQGIGMTNARGRQPALNEPPHPLPGDAGGLAPSPKRTAPEAPNLETEREHRGAVHGHPVIPQMPRHDRAQPPAHHRDRSVQASPQLGLDLAELRLQPLPDRLPYHREPSVPLLPADVREAEEVERLRLPLAGAPPVLCREWPEFQQARLLRVQLQAELRESFTQFGLELHPEKTRLLEFGPFAAENRRRAGKGKPETFNFLGFTHICGKKRNGRFTVVRQTIRERLQAKLSEVKAELRRRLHAPIPVVGRWLRSVVAEHLREYRVPLDGPAVFTFCFQVGRLWCRTLLRRSQTRRMNCEPMRRVIQRWLPPPRICHPYPLRRLGVVT